MSKRSARKRRHREDFTQYQEQKKQENALASHYKQFGYPNKIAFMKALAAHAQKRELEHEHVHDENCQHEHPPLTAREFVDAARKAGADALGIMNDPESLEILDNLKNND